MTHTEVEELVELEALSALDAEQSAALRAHVAGCPRCADRLAEAEAVGARLALAVPLHHAPAALRERILTAARLDNGLVAGDDAPNVVNLAAARTERADRSTPGQRPERRPFALGRWGALAAGVLLFPLAGLLTWTLTLQGQVNDLRRDASRIEDEQRDVIFFAAEPAIKAKLAPTEHGGQAYGYAQWKRDEGRCDVVAKHLPKPEGSMVYRVEYETANGVRDAGELTVDENGVGSATIDASRWQSREYQVRVLADPRTGETPLVLLAGTLRSE